MEDPANQPPVEDDESRRRREQEKEMERLLLEQEEELLRQEEEDMVNENNNNDGDNNNNEMDPDLALQQQLQQQQEPLEEDPNAQMQPSYLSLNRLSYTQASLWAAVALVVYALRTRRQWYLALVFIRSSKAAYIVLANALVAMCVGIFRSVTKTFLGGLRLHEAEGLGDFFRWNVTETCLALTMFRSELTVPNGILFLLLVLAKCVHWVADLREGHLRVTEESIVVREDGLWKGWPMLQWPHVKLWIMLVLLQVIDIFAVQWCGQDILNHGPSVSILFGFEAAILLVSAWNNLVLWHLHALDGWMHYLHEQTTPDQRMHRWIHPWKEHKATFTFAVEVQAQAAKFLFYVAFFAIVLTYYGMPINLFREVYVSFQALKSRLVAFAKYRRLMASMNRFQNVTEEELEEAGNDCIICRDEMTVSDGKKLPGCGHAFHKSCLREWLVQQQSCPTCRGDITVMEQQAQREAARAEAAEVRAREGQSADAEEDEREEAKATDAATAGPTTAPAPAPFLISEGKQNTPTAEIPGRPSDPSGTATKRVRIGPVIEENAPFPALYRIVKDEGAKVWNDTNEFVTRVIPFGVVVLCHKLQYKKEVGFMIRIPDGWVQEDAVVRVRTLASLKQARLGKTGSGRSPTLS